MEDTPALLGPPPPLSPSLINSFILFMTPSFENSEQKVKCEREECIMALRDVALFTSLLGALNILQKGPLIVIPMLNVQVYLSKQNYFSDMPAFEPVTPRTWKEHFTTVGLHDVDTRSIQGSLLVIDAG